jgi:hypothetical protein
MNSIRAAIKNLWHGALLLLLAICTLFWLIQVFLFLLGYFRNGWDGVKATVAHLMISNTDPYEWNRWEMKDFVVSELFILAFTVALVIASRKILKQIVHELIGLVRPNRSPRSSKPDEIGRVG